VNRTAIVTSLVAMFLTGVSAGLIGGMVFSHSHPGGRGTGLFGLPMRQGNPPGGRLAEALPRLAKSLDLTPDQVARIRPKLERTRGEFGAVRESLMSRIESELTPQQLERWRDLRRTRSFPGLARGPMDRDHRVQPGDQGEPK